MNKGERLNVGCSSKHKLSIVMVILAMIFLFLVVFSYPLQGAAEQIIATENCDINFANEHIKNAKNNFNKENTPYGGVNNTDVTVGYRIGTAEQLKEWLEMSDCSDKYYRDGYLANNITDWNKAYNNEKSELALERTLNGNGYEITAFTDSAKVNGNKTFGLLVDVNKGNLINLKVSTGNDFCFTLTEKNSYFVMGGVAGANYGEITKCVVNINHKIELTNTEQFGNTTYTDGALGSVAGVNETDLSGNGKITDTTVNLNAKGALMVNVWSKGKPAKAKLGGLVGMSNTKTTNNINNFANICVNFNGGKMEATANESTEKSTQLQVSGVTNRGSIRDWNDGQVPCIDGVIINGELDVKNNTIDCIKQYSYLIRSATPEQLKNCYLSNKFLQINEQVEVSEDKEIVCYSIPDNFTTAFADKEGVLNLSYHENSNNFTKIIQSVGDENTINQQVLQIDNAIKTVAISKAQAVEFADDMEITLINIVRTETFMDNKTANNLYDNFNVYNANILLKGLENPLVINGLSVENNTITALSKATIYNFTADDFLFYHNGDIINKFEIDVREKIIDVDNRIFLENNIIGAEIKDGKLVLSEKLDTVTLAAISNKYGIRITAINGGVSKDFCFNINGAFSAEIGLHSSVTGLSLTEEIQRVSVFASANNDELGTAIVDKANPIIGEKVTFTARAQDGYVFLGWTLNGLYVSFDSEYRTIAGSSGKKLIAVFAQYHNLVIFNGDKEIAKLYITPNLLQNLEIGQLVAESVANLGSAAVDAVGVQPYNAFYGWRVIGINDNVFELEAVFDMSLKNANISIDGVEKSLPINSDINLTEGDYLINGVAVTVDKPLTLKALAGLKIDKVNTSNEIKGCNFNTNVSFSNNRYNSIPIKTGLNILKKFDSEKITIISNNAVKLRKEKSNFSYANFKEIKGNLNKHKLRKLKGINAADNNFEDNLLLAKRAFSQRFNYANNKQIYGGASGKYDDETYTDGILHINAIYKNSAKLTVELYDTENNQAIANATFDGRRVQAADGVYITQALIKIDKIMLTYANKISARIYADSQFLGAISIKGN